MSAAGAAGTREDWPTQAGLNIQSCVYSLTLKSVLNRVQPIKSFVYESVRFSEVLPDTIEVAVVPRTGSKAQCSGCNRHGPTYDHLETRTWLMTPLWTFTLALIYRMRRVECQTCGVIVEKVPWATGKHGLCDGFRLFLAHWARYEADPLCCPTCGSAMKIISFIEGHQTEVIEKILRHCGLWEEQAARAPPSTAVAVEG